MLKLPILMQFTFFVSTVFMYFNIAFMRSPKLESKPCVLDQNRDEAYQGRMNCLIGKVYGISTKCQAAAFEGLLLWVGLLRIYPWWPQPPCLPPPPPLTPPSPPPPPPPPPSPPPTSAHNFRCCAPPALSAAAWPRFESRLVFGLLHDGATPQCSSRNSHFRQVSPHLRL